MINQNSPSWFCEGEGEDGMNYWLEVELVVIVIGAEVIVVFTVVVVVLIAICNRNVSLNNINF
jgi:hypothetical protein